MSENSVRKTLVPVVLGFKASGTGPWRGALVKHYAVTIGRHDALFGEESQKVRYER